MHIVTGGCGFKGMSHDISPHTLFQVDQEVSKLLEMKAQLQACTEGAAGGRFVLKCPKVREKAFHMLLDPIAMF